MWIEVRGRWDDGGPEESVYPLDTWLVNTDNLAQVSRATAGNEVFLYPVAGRNAEAIMVEGAEAVRVWALLAGLVD